MRTRKEIEARLAALKYQQGEIVPRMVHEIYIGDVLGLIQAELARLEAELANLPPDDGIMDWWPKEDEPCLVLRVDGGVGVDHYRDSWMHDGVPQGNLAPNTPEARAYLEGKAKFQRYLTAGQQLRIGEDEAFWVVRAGGIDKYVDYVRIPKFMICTATKAEAEAIYAAQESELKARDARIEELEGYCDQMRKMIVSLGGMPNRATMRIEAPRPIPKGTER